MSQHMITPGGVYGSMEQPHLEKPSRKCCTVKYRPRYFYSKGAFLVLLWITFISMSVYSLYKNVTTGVNKVKNTSLSVFYSLIIIIPLFACILFAGWLADAKLGNYKVFKAGAIFTFLSTVVGGAISAMEHLIPEIVVGEALIVSGSFGIFGVSICFPMALQLGLDQMPDASAPNISSFISWFAVAGSGSAWFSWLVVTLLEVCGKDSLWTQVIICLLPALCMATVCCSVFFLAPKYLLVEPKSPQSLKIIYQVLKFAAKHKAPLNRSALTYWEEDIPSRFDLGKSRYGGPFTTEQVEDVKTFFKMLLILFPITFIVSSLSASVLHRKQDIWECSINASQTKFLSIFWWLSVGFYELAIYPFIKNKLPTILKRIGIASIIILLIKCLSLAESASEISISHNHTGNSSGLDSLQQFLHWADILINVVAGPAVIFLITGVAEFVCAQSPYYSMRGLFTNCCSVVLLISTVVGTIFRVGLMKVFIKTPTLSSAVVVVVLSLLGFILYCVLARWYKLRVREEEYNVHRVVEEVYDRYLSQGR